jgi:hypothetical protein
MIVNYVSRVVNKLEALLTDNTRVIIYDRHVLIVQATDFAFHGLFTQYFILLVTHEWAQLGRVSLRG